jgi:hypothetical protein
MEAGDEYEIQFFNFRTINKANPQKSSEFPEFGPKNSIPLPKSSWFYQKQRKIYRLKISTLQRWLLIPSFSC